MVSVTCSHHGPKYYTENSRNKQFTGFKLRAILSDAMKPRRVWPCRAQDVTRPFVLHLHAADAPDRQSSRGLRGLSKHVGACVQLALVLSNNGPTAQEQ